MRFSVFTFCALLSIPPCAADDSYTLIDRWQVNFGRGQDHATYRTTVCPDGTFYLSDSFGRVAVIDAKGKVTSRRIRREFVTARTLACDAGSSLYIADPRNIWVMRAGVVVSRRQVEVMMTAVAPASNDSIYVCGSRRTNRLPLHLIDGEGRVVKSFGIESGIPFNRNYSNFEGQLLWQDDLKRLLYIPMWRDFEIQAYGRDGRSMGVFGAQGPRILPVRVSDGEPPLGQVVGVARLPGGEIAIQRAVADWGRGLPSRMLEIYDSKLRRLGVALSDARTLAGSAADGDLYFTMLSPRGLQVFKVGLVKRLSL
jgi:hypothetical protein